MSHLTQPAVEPVKKKRVDDGFVEIYNYRVPKGAPKISVELQAYRENRTPEQGGFGAEEHFKRAFRIMWPKYEWSEWVEMLIHAWCNYKYISVIGHQRASKCLRNNTLVLMHDGSSKPVQDIVVGDKLMGDDSTPRNVLSLARGREIMYSVKSSRGGEWGCNESHILSFKASRNYCPARDGLKHPFKKGDVIDLPLTEFQKKGRLWRETWKQYRVGVCFADAGFVPEVDPYIYGSWIADGHFDQPAITKPDGPITQAWTKYWTDKGLRVRRSINRDRCPSFHVCYNDIGGTRPNLAKRFFDTSKRNGEKRILPKYLTASREIRLALLAGILDGDGCASKNQFNITTKYPGLEQDIIFLARSLGLYAKGTRRVGKIKSLGFEGEYRSVYISGDLSIIPTKQKFAKGSQSNDPLCESIIVEPQGEGDYFGFEIDGNHRFLLGDFTVTHNTYTMAHIAYLDYCADPENTITSLVTVTFDGLRLRMWADMLRAMETAAVRFPFMVRSSTNEMRVYPNVEGRKDLDKFQIYGMAVRGNKDAEGRIRGAHAPRRRFFGDEAQDIDPLIYDAITSIMSADDSKCVLLTNPKHKISPFGNWCEPVGGWNSVSDRDLFWLTKKGGCCLHFDGLQSPNVKAGKTIFTGLLTIEAIEDIRKVDTENSVAWWSRVKGWFPPDGMVSKIFPDSIIVKAKPPITFDFPPVACASLDPAFEMDKAPVHFGELGRLRNGRQAINCTETQHIRYKIGENEEPKDYQCAHQIMDMCRLKGVAPENFIMDKTGGGRGVFAILQKEWSPDIKGVEYGGAATDRTLRPDESDKCNEMFKYFVSELWFRAYHYCLDGLIGGLANLDETTAEDLNSREYEEKQFSEGRLRQVESKVDYRSRLGRSPDCGDAFCQFGELLARLGSWPGSKGGGVATTTSTKWAKHRDRARRAASVYQSEGKFH